MPANITKRTIISNTNGTDELFNASEDYIDGTLWVFESKSDTTIELRQTTTVGGGFFTISPAPAAGSDLYLTYEIEGEEGGDSLNSWDSANVFALAEAIDDIRLLIVSMDKAIQKRLPLSDFYKVIELVNKRLDDYEASLLSP